MDGQVCIGCFRDPYEISNWYKLTETEKTIALEDAQDRKVKWEAFLAGSRGADNDEYFVQSNNDADESDKMATRNR